MAIEPQLFSRAAKLVAAWKRPLVLTHARPDGDAIGCLVAMRALLRGLGAQPLSLLFDPLPPSYAFLVESDPLPLLGRDVQIDAIDAADGVVVLDTCAYEQLLPLRDWLSASKRPLLALDHHVTRDLPADLYLIDITASAAALILFEWALAVEWPMGSAALEALWVGIATDTGWFRFSNTDARTLHHAAELLGHDVDAAALYDRIYNQERAGKVRLTGAALATLELLDEGNVGCMTLTPQEFRACGAEPSDTEGIINEPMRIAGLLVSILLVQQEDGVVRISLRSREPVDVASIAAALGGGGHPRAAGARLKGALAEIRKRVLEEVRRQMA